jgi:hypothetical protein
MAQRAFGWWKKARTSSGEYFTEPPSEWILKILVGLVGYARYSVMAWMCRRVAGEFSWQQRWYRGLFALCCVTAEGFFIVNLRHPATK